MSEKLKLDDNFDVLSDVLETLRFRGSIFFHSELAAPWGMSISKIGIPRFHIALAGDCYLGVDGHEPVSVEQNDIVMLPSGPNHWIADRPGRPLVTSELASEACELGNPMFQTGQISNRIMCGLVHFDQESTHPILDSLPPILHFAMIRETDSVWMTISLIDSEIRRTQRRGGAIVDRLSEVLILQLLNSFIQEDSHTSGFLAALRDRRVHRALTLIHRNPEFAWSLQSLSENVGMSRATLVRHFQDSVGEAPMAYIVNWRIMKAYNYVKYTSTPLEQIADLVGFASARTLSRAFKRYYGCTPNDLRRVKRPG